MRGVRYLVAIAIAALLPSPPGITLALVVWLLLPRFLRALPTARSRARESQRFSHATLVAEALAAHLMGGAALIESLQSVAEIDDGDLGRATRDCATLIRLGSQDPFQPWQQWPYLEPLAREMTRAVQRGGSLAAAATRAAGALRAEELRRRRIAVERVSVRVAMPVSLCLLPAFLLLAVIPPAVSLFSQIDISSTSGR